MNRRARADYDYRQSTIDGAPVLLIVDLDIGNMSLTNDAENVLAEIAAKMPGPLTAFRVFYRDSDGAWDEMVLDRAGNLADFVHGPDGVDFEAVWVAM